MDGNPADRPNPHSPPEVNAQAPKVQGQGKAPRPAKLGQAQTPIAGTATPGKPAGPQA